MKRSMIVLLMYLGIFAMLTIFAGYNLIQDQAIFNIGLSARMTDLIILVFSVLGFFKSLYHIVTF